MDRDNLLSVLAEDRERIRKAIDSVLSTPKLLREILENLKELNANIKTIIVSPVRKEELEKPKPIVVKTPPLTVGEVSIKPYKTKLFLKYAFRNLGYYEILNISGEGIIREIAVVALSPKFDIKLTVDEYTELLSFEKATQIQKYIDFIDAIVTVDGYYLFKLHNVYFQKRFVIGVSSDERIRYEYIIGVYDVL